MAAQKYIPIPEPIEVRGTRISLRNVVEHLIESDERFLRTANGIKAGVRILSAFDAAAADDRHVGPLHPADAKLLQVAADAPTDGYLVLYVRDKVTNELKETIQLGRRILPLLAAIEGMVDELPEPVKQAAK